MQAPAPSKSKSLSVARSPPELQINLNIIPLGVSPVPHLFKYYQPPTGEEMQCIQETISIAKQEEQRLKKLSARIPRYTSRAHDATYRECQKLRRDVQNFVRELEQLFTPLRILPTELLIIIFAIYIESFEFSIGLPSSNMTRNQPLTAALRLSQVCQRWRAIVLDTPQLWTILQINLNALDFSNGAASYYQSPRATYNYNDADKYLKHLQAILDRSTGGGNDGLQINLSLPADESSYLDHNSQEVHSAVMHILAGQAHRIACIAIHALPDQVNTFCAMAESLRPPACSVAFPLLRKLVLNMRQGYPSVALRIDGFTRTPALRDVVIQGTNGFQLTLPWAKLRSYSETQVRTWSWQQENNNLQAILMSATKLKRLYLSRLGYQLVSHVSERPLASPPIKVADISLEFTESSRYSNNVYSLFTYFDYPSIQTLRIPSSYHWLKPMLSVAKEYYSTLSAPLVNLTELRSCGPTPNLPDLISFLRLAPSLEKLEIEMPSCTNLQTLNSLYISPGSTIHQDFVPAFKQLFIHTNFWKQGTAAVKQILLQLKEVTGILRSNSSQRCPFPDIRLCFEDADLIFLSEVELRLNNRIVENVLPSFPGILTRWRQKLHEEVPPVATTTQPLTAYRFSKMLLKALLTEIEDYKLTSAQMRELYASGLHLSLDRLSRLPKNLLPGESVHRFRLQAKRILAKWEPLHRQDLCSPKTLTVWVLKGKRSLVFLPPNDPQRTSPDALKLIYGMADDLVEDICKN